MSSGTGTYYISHVSGGTGGAGGWGGNEGGGGGAGHGPSFHGETIVIQNDPAERHKIIEWASPLNFFPRQADILKTRQPGTGDWLLQDSLCKKWKAGEIQALWCRGIPGAGKTVLASIVVDVLRRNGSNENTSVAVLYLDYNATTETHSLTNLLAAIWRQLIRGKALPNEVQQLYHAHSESGTRPSLEEIHSVLRSTVKDSCVFVVVDALDEYPEDDRDALLQNLWELRPAVRLMLTSRPHINFDHVIPNIETLEVRATDEDILRYLDGQIEKSHRFRKHGDEVSNLRRSMEEKIVKGSGGMFLLAKLWIDPLMSKHNVGDVQDALANLSSDLDGAYDGIVKRINQQSENDRQLAWRTLSWVFNAKIPLQPSQLREALAVNPEAPSLNPHRQTDMDIISSVCAGLIMVSEADNKVRLIHYTTQMYLQSVQSTIFPYAQRTITLVCMTYMHLTFQKLPTPLPDSEWHHFTANPFLDYAIEYCLVHARGKPETEIQDKILEFLGNCSVWVALWNWTSWPPLPSNKLSIALAFGLEVISSHILRKEGPGNSLQEVASRGDTDAICFLLKHVGNESGAFVNVVGGEYDSALGAAVWNGRELAVKLLIMHGANVNTGVMAYRSTLHAAVWRGHEAIAKILLEHGADMNAKAGEHGSPLQLAFRKGDVCIIRHLMEHAGIDEKAVIKLQGVARMSHMLTPSKSKGWELGTMLQAALQMGHEGLVQLVLKHGADVNDPFTYSYLLRHASRQGHESIVQMLIAHGANMQLAFQWEKDCRAGLQQGVKSLEIKTTNVARALSEVEEDAHKRHQEVLQLIETLSQESNSDRVSTTSGVYSSAHVSSTSISMLPSRLHSIRARPLSSMGPISTMPSQPLTAEVRLENVIGYLTMTAETLGILANTVRTPLLDIFNTTQSLLKNIWTVKQNQDACTQLLEETHPLLEAIILMYINRESGGELPASVLHNIGNFTWTLHRIHTFVEAQQSGSKFKNFFCRGEINNLLKDCRRGLQQGVELFEIKTTNVARSLSEIEENAHKQRQEVLQLIETLSQESNSDSDRVSTTSGVYSSAYPSSTSISMLPSEPKIFHGRESEISKVLKFFNQGTPRIAILGTGGIGKTTLARALIHHTEIISRYGQYRYFVACDSAATKVELAALVGACLGLKPGQDLTQAVVNHFSSSAPSLLVLDNLETVWEPTESRHGVEEFLSLLTDIGYLGLVITMRGAERPAKVQWSQPFLPPLEPLDYNAAQKTFLDIVDSTHEPEEVDKVLALTDNMPLAISLLAHLVDTEGCSIVLSRWKQEKTSLISDGYDKSSNLELSIALSLSSPRLSSLPQAKELLSLLSILPNGLSDADLIQTKLPLDNIQGCKAALIDTSLAYRDRTNRLKVFIPIREYIQEIQPLENHLIRPLLKHFQGLLEFYEDHYGALVASSTITRISSNFTNIQNVLRNGLQQGHPDLKDSIYCTCYLNTFSQLLGRGVLPMIALIPHLFPVARDYELEACVMTEMISSWPYLDIFDPQKYISKVLEIFELFGNTKIKFKFYVNAADYLRSNNDFPTATKFLQSAISLAISTGNTRQHVHALCHLAWMKLQLGDYSAARSNAYESQDLAKGSENLYTEALSLHIAAHFYTLGQSISICNRAMDLLSLCGMSGGSLSGQIQTTQAEAHRLKSEYLEAYTIQTQILHESSVKQDTYQHGLAALNVAQLCMNMDAPKQEVQKYIHTAKLSLVGMGLRMRAECVQADLSLREGDEADANMLLCKNFKALWGKNFNVENHCLEILADVTRWNGFHGISIWPTILLAHSLKSREKLGVHKALQFLGDLSLIQDDEETAVSLFTVALEGFIHMDVHRSKAECMLRLGDISQGHSDLVKAAELWETARPLFERSSQGKQVKNIDERCKCV